MSTEPGHRGKLNAHHSTGAARICPRAKQTPWKCVMHTEPPEEQGPQHPGCPDMPGKVPWDQILALQQAHGAKAWLSMCPEAEREQLQPGWTDGWTRGGERGNQAVTPGSPVLARGGGVLSISWPAEPSHPTNLPPASPAPQGPPPDHTAHPSPEVWRAVGRGGDSGGGGHTSATHSGAIPHPGSPATAQHPAGRPQGGNAAISPGKNPPHIPPAPVTEPGRRKQPSPPLPCLPRAGSKHSGE